MLYRFLLGDDIFISYSRRDAATYAAGLANELVKLGFTCRFDQWGTQPGKEIPAALKRAIRNSALFVLVGSDGATQSKAVAEELAEFKRTKRMIVPIDLGGVIRNAQWWTQIEGLHPAPETSEALVSGNPSPAVVNRIEKTFKFTRRDQRLRRTSLVVGAILLLLIAGTVVAIMQARKERASAAAAITDAKREKETADTAKKQAEEQRRIAETKTNEARISDANARAQQDIAHQKSQLADIATKNAQAQQKIAAAKTIEANHQQKRAEERERQAVSNQIAAQANVAISSSPARSLLYSIEALRITDEHNESPLPSALQALQLSLSSAGGKPLNGHAASVRKVVMSNNNLWMASEDDNDRVRLWKLDGEDLKSSILLPPGSGSVQALDNDHNILITAERGSTVTLWDLNADDGSALPSKLSYKGNHPDFAAISENHRWLVTSGNGELEIWDLHQSTGTSNQPILLNGYGGETDVAISNDGRRVVAVGKGSWTLWKTSDTPATRYELQTSVTSPTNVRERSVVAFSPNSQWLMVGYQSAFGAPAEPLLHLWDLTKVQTTVKSIDLVAHPKGILSALFSPNSHWLVTTGYGGLNNDSPDAVPLLWDLTNADSLHKPHKLHGHDAEIRKTAISPDSRWLVTASWDSTARLWDLNLPAPEDKPVVLRGHGSAVEAAAFSNDGRWVITGSRDATIRLWRLNQPDPARGSILLRGHEKEVETLFLSSDSQRLISGSADHSLRLWNLTNPQASSIPIVLQAHLGFSDVRINPEFDDQFHWMITQGHDQAIVWDLKKTIPTDDQRISFEKDRTYIPGISLSPKGSWLVAAEDKITRLWNLKTRGLGEPFIISGQQSAGTRVIFSPDEHWLLTSSEDGTVYLCDLFAQDPARAAQPLPDYKNGISSITGSVSFSADGRWLATSGNEVGTVFLWDLTSIGAKAGPRILRGHQAKVSFVVFSPNSHWLATSAWDVTEKIKDDKAVRLWNLTKPQPEIDRVVLRGQEYPVTDLTFSGDNRWLVTATEISLRRHNDSATARLWNLNAITSDSKPFVLPGHKDRVTAVVFSPDNHWLATGGNDDAKVRVWDLHSPDPTARVEILGGHKKQQGDHIWQIKFSADGRWLLTANYSDEIARLWDLHKKEFSKFPSELTGHDGAVQDIAISADSKWLITVSADTTARLWFLTEDSTEIRSILLGNDEFPIDGATFTADNREAITWGSGGRVRIWPLKIQELLERAAVIAGRNLTWVEWNQIQNGIDYRKTLAQFPTDQSTIDGMIEKARVLMLNDKKKEASDIYSNVLSLVVETGDADLCNRVAWRASLDGFPKIGLGAAEKALQIQPDAMWMRDTRGLALALTGNFRKAVDDFQAYVDWTRANDQYDQYGRKREAWIQEILSGHNPFTPKVLTDLRDE